MAWIYLAESAESLLPWGQKDGGNNEHMGACNFNSLQWRVVYSPRLQKQSGLRGRIEGS